MRLNRRALFLSVAAVSACAAALFGRMPLPEAGAAWAETAATRSELREVERALEAKRAAERSLQRQATALRQEVERLRREMVAVAADARERESLLTRLEDQLAALEADAATRSAGLTGQRQQLGYVLRALSAVAHGAPEAALLLKGEPIDAVRAAIVLKATAPRVDRRARELAIELEALSEVKRDIASKLLDLRQAQDEVDHARARLADLVARKAALVEQNAGELQETQRRAAILAKQAGSLRELLAGLERPERPSPPQPTPEAQVAVLPAPVPAPLPLPQPKPEPPTQAQPRHAPGPGTDADPAAIRAFPTDGPITMPVSGRLIRHYGAATGHGATAKGVTLAARDGAHVVAPFDGKAVFAGPFRGHGQILIIEHSGGYHSLLAGMARIDAVLGQWLLAGEPVGVMSMVNGETPHLYLELRRDGQPINPARWLATAGNKVRG